MKLRTALLEVGATVALLTVAIPALATDSKPPQWYEIATGVIAIPVALIGLAYSYLLICKTRLETQKIELEIREKERQLAEITGGSPVPLTQVIAPVGESRITLLLLLRFVVLWLILSAWGLFEDAFGLLFTSIVVGAQQLWEFELSGWTVLPLIVVQKLPKIAYWIVFFALAWPLFKDVNAALGVDVKKFLKVSSLRELRGVASHTDS